MLTLRAMSLRRMMACLCHARNGSRGWAILISSAKPYALAEPECLPAEQRSAVRLPSQSRRWFLQTARLHISAVPGLRTALRL